MSRGLFLVIRAETGPWKAGFPSIGKACRLSFVIMGNIITRPRAISRVGIARGGNKTYRKSKGNLHHTQRKVSRHPLAVPSASGDLAIRQAST